MRSCNVYRLGGQKRATPTCTCCSSAWPQPCGSQTACRIRHCCKLRATPRSGRFPGGSWFLWRRWRRGEERQYHKNPIQPTTYRCQGDPLPTTPLSWSSGRGGGCWGWKWQTGGFEEEEGSGGRAEDAEDERDRRRPMIGIWVLSPSNKAVNSLQGLFYFDWLLLLNTSSFILHFHCVPKDFVLWSLSRPGKDELGTSEQKGITFGGGKKIERLSDRKAEKASR